MDGSGCGHGAASAAFGKFATGAALAGFGYLFNELLSGKHGRSSEDQMRQAGYQSTYYSADQVLCDSECRYIGGAATSICPECNLIGAGGALKGLVSIYDAAKGGLVLLSEASLSGMTTAGLKAVYGKEGAAMFRQLFGTDVAGAEAALASTVIPQVLAREVALMYREIAVRNISAQVQQIRLQIIDKILPYLPK